MSRVIYFSTPHCNPCIQFKPVCQIVCRDLGLSLDFVDASQNPQMAQKYGVTSVPTLVIEDGSGVMVKKHTGAIPKAQLTSMLHPYSAN